MMTNTSPRHFRSRLAVLTVGLVFTFTIACDEAATLLDDAATSLRDMGADADAQPVPLEPLVLNCSRTYQQVETLRGGMADSSVTTRSGRYDEILVQDPTQWVVEHCGRAETRLGWTPTPVGCDAPDAVCTGDYPPTPDCALSLPSYTGTTIQVRCDRTTRTVTDDSDTSVALAFRSIRLVPRTDGP